MDIVRGVPKRRYVAFVAAFLIETKWEPMR